MSNARRRERREDGFTLIELIVVITIIGILAGTVVVATAGRSDQAAAKRVLSDFNAILSAAQMYREDHREWPQSLDELMNPPELPSGGTMKYLKTPPRDPWSGEYYIYDIEGSEIILISYGADQSEGGSDWDADIRSDEMNEQR